MGYDRQRFRALQVADRILEEKSFISNKERLVLAFNEGVEWANRQLPRKQGDMNDKMLQIQKAVIDYFNLQSYDVWERTRFTEIVQARKWIWYWWRKVLEMPFTKIAEYCGFHYSTVVIGVNEVVSRMDVYPPIKTEYKELKGIIEAL